MKPRPFGAAGLMLWILAGCPGTAAAQGAEPGSRAQGMAGAFVAVADDASAVYWNPAGLGGAVVVGGMLDLFRGHGEPDASPASAEPGAEARKARGTSFAVALPQLGLSHYRLRHWGAVAGPAGLPAGSREVEGREVSFQSVDTRHLGLTLVQSLADGVVVGTTLRLVSGGAAAGGGPRTGDWPALVDEADGLETGTARHVDLDAGLMVGTGPVRMGLVVHNMREPALEMGAGEGTVTLERRARVGLAYGPGWPGRSRWIVAVETDLTRQAAAGGERRDVAAGVEAWGVGHRLGVRGGMRASTVGEARPVGTAGVSLGLTASLFVDAHVSAGRDGADRAWGVGGRVVY